MSRDYYNANCQLVKHNDYEIPNSVMYSDNPNYFNTAETKPPETGKRFFLFRRRNEKSEDSLPNGKTSGFRSLLRSKSGSSSPMTITQLTADEVDYTAPEFETASRKKSRNGTCDDISDSHETNDDVFTLQKRKEKCSATLRPKSISLTEKLTNNRRHSIGSFIAKEKCRTGSISDEVPKMPAPKPPTFNVGARLKDHYKLNDDPNARDDILIITARHSEVGIICVNYLKTCFDKITKQRGRVPFRFLHLKIDSDKLSNEIAQRCLVTKLQIIIICSSLLELSQTYLMQQLTAILKPDKVLGLLLDVTEEKVGEVHKLTFPHYKQWRRCVVRSQDHTFVCDFLGIATDILGRALRQQPLTNDPPVSVSPNHFQNSSNSNKSLTTDNFTIVPRKVKIGQNKVVVLLNDPLSFGDCIKIKIERVGQIVELTNVKRRNPYAIQINIPESFMETSMIINVRVEKNNRDLGSRPVKCESRLKELEQILNCQDNPMEFMCSALGVGIGEQEKLDSILAQSFKKNISPEFHVLAGTGNDRPSNKIQELAMQEYPTLLHFAARWGLEKLCIQLLECPGGVDACDFKNASEKTPSELADCHGYIKLSSTINNFSHMNEFTTMYQYFKGISGPKIEQETDENTSKFKENKTNSKYTGEGYIAMSAVGDDVTDSAINAVSNLNYLNVDATDERLNELSINLELRTNVLKIFEPSYVDSNEVNSQHDLFDCTNTLEQLSSFNTSTDNSEIEEESELVKNILNVSPKPKMKLGDYLTHPSNIPVSNPNYTNISIMSPKSLKTTYVEESSHHRLHFKKKNEKQKSLQRQASDVSKKSVDDELLEIINDFKNNVFTIHEVEQLVTTWKNRNDVQQSFVEKAEQLQNMREKYDRIQKEMKEKLKRPTPFERVKKFFSRNKSPPRDIPSEASTPTVDDIKFSLITQSNHRPISSMSLQSVSSSSSGRMSTGSACSSFGDSGTHSDNENRRNICTRNTPLDNYLIPPAPRPIVSVSSISTPTSTDEKYHIHFPHVNNSSDHYIMFPSNIPYTPTDHHLCEYLNYPTLKTIEEVENEIPVSLQSIKKRTELPYTRLRKTEQSSSFKPNSPAVTMPVVEKHSVIQFQDVNKNTEQLLNELKFNQLCKSIEDLSDDISVMHTLHHEYMNIKI